MGNTELDKTLEQTFEKEAVKLLLEDDLKNKYAALLADKHNVTKIERRSIKLSFAMKAAAAVLVLFCGYFLITHSLVDNSNKQFALKLAKDTYILGNQDVQRKDVSTSDLTRLQANAAFVNKNYDEAINHFEKLNAINTANEVDQFYLAVSYMKSDDANPQKALAIFNEFKTTDNLYSEVEWFKALAFVAIGNDTEARKLLLDIITNNKYKVTEAKILLKKLKKQTLS